MALPAQHCPNTNRVTYPESIESLRLAMSSTYMLDLFRREWPYSQRMGFEITECEIGRVHPRGAKGFLLEYHLHLTQNGERRVQPLFGELIGDSARQRYREIIKRLQKPRRKQLAAEGPTDGIVCLPSLGMVLRLPGLDERLYGLKLVHDPDEFELRLSRHVVHPGKRIQGISSDILGHRLGKRCIVRFRYTSIDSGTGEALPGSVIGKFYKYYSDQGREVTAVMESLCGSGFGEGAAIRIPRPLCYVPELRVLLMEDVPGTPLADLEGAPFIEGVARAGGALAKLHRSVLKVPGRYTINNEIALLENWVALVSEVYPQLRNAITEALMVVFEALDRCREHQPVIVHRDFYEKQVLIDGADTVLIDFDTLCGADAALDIGNFMAHLHLAREQGRNDLASAKNAFLQGYGSALSTDIARRTVAYTQSSLLRLVCIYSFCTRWRHLVEPLLEVLHGDLQVSI